jgi:hypothetical protein
VFELLLGLLVVWVVAAIVGALVEGLFWLTLVGAGLFLVTAVVAGARSSDPASR